MRPLAIAAAAAVAGLVALAILFPRHDPSASTPLAIDREQAVARVRQFASRYGADTSGWRAYVSDETDPKLEHYLTVYPADPVATLFRVLTFHVTLIQPGGRQKIRMTLFADGRPAEWRWENPASASRPAPTPEMVLADFAGAHGGRFVPNGESNSGAQRYDWDAPIPRPFQLEPSLRMEQRAGILRSVSLRPVYRDEFEKQYTASTQDSLFRQIALGATVLAWAFALGLLFWQMFQGRVRWRTPLVLAAVQLAWGAIAFWGEGYAQQYAARSKAPIDILFDIAKESGGSWSPFWFLVFAAAGFAIRSAGTREKWSTLEELVRGKLFNHRVSRSIAVGMLGGIALAAIPYLVAALPGLPGNRLQFRSMDVLVAPSVPVAAICLSAATSLLGLFGCFIPFLRYLRKPALSWSLIVLLGIAVLMGTAPFHDAAPAFATALLLLPAYFFLYSRSDLLSVAVAAIAARAVVVPWVLWVQPVPSIRSSVLGLATLGAALLAASVYWAFHDSAGEPETIDTYDPALDAPRKSERERLQAEFEVARKAQQDALPAEPPSSSAYTLAGWCEPAQQVGGDLYDFFPLPDGRLGIAVADVSGKGVPAALYMMLTKGLLVAASRDSSRLAYILEQINLHLYRACRKKVFVTLAAVVLDSDGRRIEYGRAGHNPIVWRRTRRGETTLVKPPGLGLGLTPGERFSRNLRVDEWELEPDDAIVLYSDGVTEAINRDLEQYGEARLMRAIEKIDGRPAAESRDAILRDLSEFMGDTPARDDITLVVIRV